MEKVAQIATNYYKQDFFSFTLSFVFYNVLQILGRSVISNFRKASFSEPNNEMSSLQFFGGIEREMTPV